MGPEEQQAMASGTADANKPNACFGLTYQVGLLAALGAPKIKGVSVEIMRKINGGDVDWALGAAITHTLEQGAGSASSLPFGTDAVGDVRVLAFIIVTCAVLSLIL